MTGGLGPCAETGDGAPPEDVRKRDVLPALVSQGDTGAVIEHNREVIKTADWVIDLSPGGDKGGEIVATGAPEAVAKVERSWTGGICGGCYKSLA